MVRRAQLCLMATPLRDPRTLKMRSRAARMGLKANDVVLEVDGPIGNVKEFLDRFKRRPEGGRHVVTLWRNQSEKKLIVDERLARE